MSGPWCRCWLVVEELLEARLVLARKRRSRSACEEPSQLAKLWLIFKGCWLLWYGHAKRRLGCRLAVREGLAFTSTPKGLAYDKESLHGCKGSTAAAAAPHAVGQRRSQTPTSCFNCCCTILRELHWACAQSTSAGAWTRAFARLIWLMSIVSPPLAFTSSMRSCMPPTSDQLWLVSTKLRKRSSFISPPAAADAGPPASGRGPLARRTPTVGAADARADALCPRKADSSDGSTKSMRPLGPTSCTARTCGT